MLQCRMVEYHQMYLKILILLYHAENNVRLVTAEYKANFRSLTLSLLIAFISISDNTLSVHKPTTSVTLYKLHSNQNSYHLPLFVFW